MSGPYSISDMEMRDEGPRIAVIDAERCIGCVKCIRACPVDAILGAAKQVHAVLPGFCTGCGLCLPPCPVDCISLVGGFRSNMRINNQENQSQTAHELRERYLAKRQREQEGTPDTTLDEENKRAYIKEAISRSRSRREQIRRPRKPDEVQGGD